MDEPKHKCVFGHGSVPELIAPQTLYVYLEDEQREGRKHGRARLAPSENTETSAPMVANYQRFINLQVTRMWANAKRDGRPAKYRWRPVFNAAKFR